MFDATVGQIRRRVKWAGVGAAIGAGAGALVNPKYAGAGGALGGTAGALAAEVSTDVETRVSVTRERLVEVTPHPRSLTPTPDKADR